MKNSAFGFNPYFLGCPKLHIFKQTEQKLLAVRLSAHFELSMRVKTPEPLTFSIGSSKAAPPLQRLMHAPQFAQNSYISLKSLSGISGIFASVVISAHL